MKRLIYFITFLIIPILCFANGYDYWEPPNISWANDGSKIAYSNNGQIIVYSVKDTILQEITISLFDIPFIYGYLPRWSQDGKELMYVSSDSTLVIRNIKSGKIKTIADEYRVESAEFSPKGNKVAYTYNLGIDEYGFYGKDIFIADVKQGKKSQKRLTYFGKDWSKAYQPLISPDGKWLLYLYMNLNDESRDIQYEEVRLISTDGKSSNNLYLNGDGNHYSYPCWMPDSKGFVYQNGGWGMWNIYFTSVGASWSKRIIENGCHPNISPDGKRIAFSRATDYNGQDIYEGPRGIFIANIDGTNEKQITEDDGYIYVNPIWSPDGKRIVCGITDGTNIERIRVIRVE